MELYNAHMAVTYKLYVFVYIYMCVIIPFMDHMGKILSLLTDKSYLKT